MPLCLYASISRFFLGASCWRLDFEPPLLHPSLFANLSNTGELKRVALIAIIHRGEHIVFAQA